MPPLTHLIARHIHTHPFPPLASTTPLPPMSSRMVKRAVRAQLEESHEEHSESSDLDQSQPKAGNAFCSLLAGSSDEVGESSSSSDETEAEVEGSEAEVEGSKPEAAAGASVLAAGTGSCGPIRRGQQEAERIQEASPIIDGEVDVLSQVQASSSTTATCAEEDIGKSAVIEGAAIWQLDPRHLDMANELGARFGKDTMRKLAAADRLEQRRAKAMSRGGAGGGRCGRSRIPSRHMFGAPRDTWPPIGGGLGMDIDRGHAVETQTTLPSSTAVHGLDVVGNSSPLNFVFSMTRAYRESQLEMEMAVTMGDPNALQRILAAAPYNVDGLVRLADYCMYTGQNELASECISKALFACESAFHPQIRARLLDGSARVRWSREANRPLFRAIFRQMQSSTRCGCHRTALELGRLLFSLDPEADPLNMLLHLDFLALMAGEARWLLAFTPSLPFHGLPLYPQYAISIAVAMRLEAGDSTSEKWSDLGAGRRFDSDADGTLTGTSAAADAQLCRAMLLFPAILPMLVREVAPDKPRALLTIEAWEDALAGSHPLHDEECGATLGTLIRLYVTRHAPFWKGRPALLAWMISTAEALLSRLASEDAQALALATECTAVRQVEYFAGAHEHNEFGEADPSDFSLALPAQLPAEALAAAMADPDGPLPELVGEVLPPGRLVVPRSQRMQLRAQTHPVLQFFLSLVPWAMPPPNLRPRARAAARHDD